MHQQRTWSEHDQNSDQKTTVLILLSFNLGSYFNNGFLIEVLSSKFDRRNIKAHFLSIYHLQVLNHRIRKQYLVKIEIYFVKNKKETKTHTQNFLTACTQKFSITFSEERGKIKILIFHLTIPLCSKFDVKLI